jgi:hypothetical protein
MATNRYIVVLKKGTDRASFIKELTQQNINIPYVFVARPLDFVAQMDENKAATLRQDSRVFTVSIDEEIYPSAIQPIAPVGQQSNWGLDRIDQRSLPLNNKFSYSRTGRDVDLYIIDTGIRYTHSEFQGRARILPGFDPFGDNGIDDWKTNGHGTTVASVAGGRTCGVAKNVNIFSVKVFKQSSGYASTFIDACAAVKQHHLSKGNTNPSVVNMSLSFSGRLESINNAVRDLIENGIIVVNSAGNNNQDASNYSPQSTELDFRAIVKINAADIGNTIEFFVGSDPNSSSAIKLNTVPVPFTGNIVSLVENICYNINQLSSTKHISNDGLVSQGFHAYAPSSPVGRQLGLTDDCFLITTSLTQQWADRDAAITWKFNGTFNTPSANASANVIKDHRDVKLIVVGAVDETDTRAWFTNTSTETPNIADGNDLSNYGSVVDLFAPGTSIYGAQRTGDTQYIFQSGTSFSAPLTSGVICLHLEGREKNTIKVKEIHDWLIEVSTKGVLKNIPETRTVTEAQYAPEKIGTYTLVEETTGIVKWKKSTVNWSFIDREITNSNITNYHEVGSTIRPLWDSIFTDIIDPDQRKQLIEAQIRQAFSFWSEYAQIDFVKVDDDGRAPDQSTIDIRFGVEDIVDTNGDVLAHGFYPYTSTNGLTGDVHFDIDNTAQFKWNHGYSLTNGEIVQGIGTPLANGLLFLVTAIHEIGHAIGIGHTYSVLPENPTSRGLNVMEPDLRFSITAYLRKHSLGDGDISAAQKLYGRRYMGTVSRTIGGTPNRLLYSHYTNMTLEWVTLGDLGTIIEMTPFQTTIEAHSTNEAGDDLTVWYSSSDLPSWLQLNATTGIVSGMTPEVTDDVQYDFTVTATDGQNTISRIFTVNVRHRNTPPKWLEPYQPERTFTVFEKTTIDPYTVSVIDEDGDTIVMTRHPVDWPEWLTFIFNGEDLSYSNPAKPRARRFFGTVTGTTPDLPRSEDQRRYKAVIRAHDGIEYTDRTVFFTVLQEPNVPPVWVTPAGSLGEILEQGDFDFALQATDSNGDRIFYLIEDEENAPLPPGLNLNTTTGHIIGRPEPVDHDRTYTFTISAYDGFVKIPRDFSLTVKNVEFDAVPHWKTPTGLVGSILSGGSAYFVIEAEDPLGRPITFSEFTGGGVSRLPAGLTIHANGAITGQATPVGSNTKYTFTIEARPQNGTYPIRRDFSIMVLSTASKDTLTWITTAGNIGEVGEESPSTMYCEAKIESSYSGNTDIKYMIGNAEIIPAIGNQPSHFLPAGLTLTVHQNKALIVGCPNLINGDQTINFTLQAFVGPASNPSGISAVREFNLTVKEIYPDEYIDVSLPLMGANRHDWISWNTSSLIADDLLYRPTDANFGRMIEPNMYLIGGLRLIDVGNPIGEFTKKIGIHHRAIKLFMGDLNLVKVMNQKRDKVLYEVIYIPLVDNGAGHDFATPYTHFQTTGIEEVTPASINNMRQELRDNIGFIRENGENFPPWMTVQRTVNGKVVFGYQPAMVVAYVRPGQGERALKVIRSKALDTAFVGRQIDLDRYLLTVVKNGGKANRTTKYVTFPTK